MDDFGDLNDRWMSRHVILDDQWMRRLSTSPIDQFFTSPSVNYPLRCCPGPMAGHFSTANVLLVFQIQPSLALLLFQADRFVADVQIEHFVNDLCWSKTTEVFLVATNAGLYEFHPGDRQLTRIEQTFSGKLVSLTCSDTDVFIVQASEMILSQHDVNRPFDRRGQWPKTDLIHPRTDRTIDSIRIDQEQKIRKGIDSNRLWSFVFVRSGNDGQTDGWSMARRSVLGRYKATFDQRTDVRLLERDSCRFL